MKFLIFAFIAFFSYERITGLTKTCVYTSPIGEHAITINAAQLCPLQIRV